MRKFKINYRALILGGIINLGLVILLKLAGLVVINPDYVSETIFITINILSFLLSWGMISFCVHKFPLYKLLMVLGVLALTVFVESVIKRPFNPVTNSLLVIFWLGVAYLLLNDFFNKYRLLILSVYGAVLAYFLIYRMMPDYGIEQHKSFLALLLIPIPILGILWVYEQWRWLKNLEEGKAKAELTLLRNQINPHFFFNTLNNLYGLAVEKSDLAPEMILKLSDIMRYTIYDGNADYVPLKEEVNYLEDYIELHKIRYQKEVDISIHKDLQHQHKIAPLLLIIPLENAFKHGVESLAKQAFIKMELITTPKGIKFNLTNNYEADEKKSGGIGLVNLRKRLELIYPRKHKLEIIKTIETYTVSLEIESNEVPNH
ncbi:MAG: sensor histidine kinase [Bacteroidia bacterium]|nr:sensor histidine kinase [Bacteroidia bacterium]